jgi:hypothetical protein
MSWLDMALADPNTPRIFILRAKDLPHRQRLAAIGFRVAAEDARYVAFAR